MVFLETLLDFVAFHARIYIKDSDSVGDVAAMIQAPGQSLVPKKEMQALIPKRPN